jgi:hypothetical protein
MRKKLLPVTFATLLAACSSGYAVRPVARITKDAIGEPVSQLVELFGEPRKIDSSTTKTLYVWFLPQKPRDLSPSGFQGCELEVSVDPRSKRVLGFSQTNLGYTTCAEVMRKVRIE